MEGVADIKNKICEFVEHHPYILVIVAVLVVVILVIYFGPRALGYGSARKKKSSGFNDEEEIDALIDSIHRKQKKGAKVDPE